MHDLPKLESDEGILVDTGDDHFLLRASIAAFCGDGLAVHDIFELLSPAATHFCRMCMYTKRDLRNRSLEPVRKRDEALFAEHLELLERTAFCDASKTATGVKGDCCLHNSGYFHTARNKIFDIMHDLLCGNVPMTLKLLFYTYISV